MTSQQKERLKWFFGVCLSSALVIGAAWYLKERMGLLTLRLPASAPEIHEVLAGKGTSVVDVTIRAVNKSELTKGSILNLEATIVAEENLDEMHFEWLMPKEGLEPLGALSGRLGSLHTGENTKLSLSVRSATDENRHIHLHVFKMVDGEAMGRMVQYSTLNQEKTEAALIEKAVSLKRIGANPTLDRDAPRIMQ